MRAYIVNLTAALLLVACGPSSKPASIPSDAISEWADGMPKCSDVWIEGVKLPADYEGCEGSGGVIEAAVSACTNAVYTRETPGHGFFTDRERVIHDGGEDYANDPAYVALRESC